MTGQREEFVRQLGKGRELSFAAAVAGVDVDVALQWAQAVGWPDETLVRRAAVDIERAREAAVRERLSPVMAGTGRPTPATPRAPRAVKARAQDRPAERVTRPIAPAVPVVEAAVPVVEAVAQEAPVASVTVLPVPAPRRDAHDVLPAAVAEQEQSAEQQSAEQQLAEQPERSVSVGEVLPQVGALRALIAHLRPDDAVRDCEAMQETTARLRQVLGSLQDALVALDGMSSNADAKKRPVPTHDKVCRLCGQIVTAEYMARTGRTVHAHPELDTTERTTA